MIIYQHSDDVNNLCVAKRKSRVSSGFVPTMGALHSGHIGLVNRARQENDFVVCSIFVNPTQFNDPKDFKQYPTTLEQDIYQLMKAGCDLLFLPGVVDIYPHGLKPTRQYNLGLLETVLEGKFRPGHFQGVCQVVHRLLDIVVPMKLYLGQKDYQQCMVINTLATRVSIDTEIIVCPTRREKDGLAMSSRNLRLNEEERTKAPLIYQALEQIKKSLKPGNLNELTAKARLLLGEQGFKVDYVEIADAATLEPIQQWDGKKRVIALIAAFLNEIRLIDNMVLND